MIFLRAPRQPLDFQDPPPCVPGAHFSADIDLLDTRIGTLAVQRETGAWAYLDALEAQVLGALANGGSATAAGLAGRQAFDRDAVERYFVQLWDRGLLTADGRWAMTPAARWSEIETQSRYVFSLTLILSSGCNLGCRYCYLGQEDPASWVRLAKDEALRAVDWALTRDAALTAFDLGEITMAGSQWRELAEEIRTRAKERGRAVQLMIQTNGTTLDDAAVDFIRRHEVSVGISLDGPAAAHDKARPYRGGRRGSHARVIETFNRLKRFGVHHWVVATVGRHNVGDAESLIDYLASLDAPDFVLKPVLPFGLARDAWSEVGILPDEYAVFLRLAVRRALAHSSVRLDLTTRQFLLRALGSARGWIKPCTSRLCGCGEQRVVLDADTRWTPCPRFGEYASEPGAPPPDGIAGPKLALPDWSRTLPDACARCAWQAHCGGGCALAGPEDPYCSSYKANFEAIFEEVIPGLIEKPVAASASLGPLETVESTWETRRCR